MYRTFRPSSVAYNSTEPAHLAAAGIAAVSPLSLIGNGSMSDDSDATGATLYASSQTDGYHSTALAVDFDPIAGIASEWFGFFMRVRKTDSWSAYPSLSDLGQWVLHERGNPSHELGSGSLSSFTVAGDTATYASGDDWYTLHVPFADSIATLGSSGATLVVTTKITNDPGFDIPIYDFFELGLRFDVPGARTPHCRIVQRGNDGLGLTGGQRVVQRRTIQSSNRAFGIR